MKYCQSCDREYSDAFINKHYSSDKHLKKTFEIKNTHKLKNIPVNDIDIIRFNLFEEYKQKFIYFLIICKINNRKKRGKPKHLLLKHYDKDTMIDVEFNMYSSIEYLSYNYYLSQPKSALESLLAKKILINTQKN